VQALCASGVDGGRNVYAGVIVPPREGHFNAICPSDLNLELLKPYAKKAEQFLMPVPVETLLNDPAFADEKDSSIENWSTMHEIAKEIDATCKPCRVSAVAGKIHPNLPSYMDYATENGIELRSLHLVTKIEELNNELLQVSFLKLSQDGDVLSEGTITCRNLIVSAGSINTTELMLRNRQYLPKCTSRDNIGLRSSLNGNLLAGALKSKDPMPFRSNNITAGSGPEITAIIDMNGVIIEDYKKPEHFAKALGKTSLSQFICFIKACLGIRPSQAELAKANQDLLLFVGVGEDSGKGQMYINFLGNLSMKWPGGVLNDPAIKRLINVMKLISTKLGRTFVLSPLSLFGKVFTYHPLGGCTMGDHPATSVVNSYGELWGYEGRIILADGSVVPGALGSNPVWTITALAERIAEHFIQKLTAKES
ncbi:MAG: hypothetical protein K2X81_10855, partial [Candidatus Obscuribacterales bacterium]|nr:hypothetical protein [Candidatus Obscuribacterales bacterium]